MTLTIDRIGFVFYVNPAVRPSRTCTTFSFVIYARNSIYGVIYSTLQRTFKISQVITNVEYKEMISSHFSEKKIIRKYTQNIYLAITSKK